MVSRSISRILNWSTEYANSFSKSDEIDSFTSFYFDDEESLRVNTENEHDLTESDLFKEVHEESFSNRHRVVFEHFEKERKYLGVITYIDHDGHTFSANLVDSEDMINRDVVFSIDDIPPEDAPYIDVGRRIIYIYGKQYRNGTVTNESKVYFRKDENWTEREIDRKREMAEELYHLLNKKAEEDND